MIEAGAPAPDFTLPDQHGNHVSLADHRGRPVVLYFYPRANTPGCTTQACGVRDHASEYEAAGAVVLGVSPDTVESVRKFADRYGLGFPLLADSDHEVAQRYGTWGRKSSFGKAFWGVRRSTFVIDPDGNVARVFPKVSAKSHDAVVLAALRELADERA